MSWRSADRGDGSVERSTAEGFGFLTEASAAVEALTAAAQLGVLDQLDSGSITAEDLVATVGMTRYQGHLLLGALARLGFAKAAEKSRFTSTVPDLNALVQRLLPSGRLFDVLGGHAPPSPADTPGGSARLYPALVRFLASGFRAAAVRAADELVKPGLRVLDIGAGAAPWSLALAERDDTVRVVVMDLPEVIPVTRSAVADAGLGGRFDFVAGDLFETDLGTRSYDLVVIGGICHLFDDDANRLLLSKAARAIVPDGTVALMEALPNDRLDGPRSVLLYALNLATRTAKGGVRPYSAYVEWLRSGGLGRVDRVELTESPPVTLITATRLEQEGTP